ncbi:MAG: RNA polymerase sigma factor [Ignavibacteria bacterium]
MSIPGLINQQATNQDDDFALIQRFIDGDDSTFRTLVMRHKDKVQNLVYLTLGNRENIDDISQDVFISVFNKLKDFRFESQFTTWLYRITVNKCKDHLRKIRIRSIFIPVNESEDEYGSSDSSSEYVDTTEIVQQAIARLPEKLKIPLIMREVDSLSYKEIAESLECEVGTIKSRIFRARESLKFLLQPFEKDLMM